MLTNSRVQPLTCVNRPRRQRCSSRPRAVLDAAADQWPVYIALGLPAAGFIGTFFVAPRFKESFKEEIPWEEMFASLQSQGVASLPPAVVSERLGGWFRRPVLLDVREANATPTVPGAVRAPLYREILDFDLASNIRRAAFAFFAVPGTERDPNWLRNVEEAVKDKSTNIVVCCQSGGKLENKPGMKLGFQSRSLKAVYLLRAAGYRNVDHLAGGVRAWRSDGLAVEE